MKALLGALLLLAASGYVQAQPAGAPPAAAVVLKVEGLVDKPLNLSAADLEKMPRRTVEAKDHDGKAASFTGVALAEILKAAGAPLGATLRGPQMAKYLLVEAADGYRAVFARHRAQGAAGAVRERAVTRAGANRAPASRARRSSS